MDYQVTLEMPGMQTKFITDNKDSTLDAFEKGNVLHLTKPNGNVFAVRTEDYSYISVDALEKNDERGGQ